MSAASALKAAEARVAVAKADVAAVEEEFAAATAPVAAEEAEGAGAVVAADISTAAGVDAGPSEQRLIGKRGEKRKQPYPYSESDSSTDDDVPYKFEVDSEGELPEMKDYNYKSFTMQVEEQLWKEGCSVYMNKSGDYFCKFHKRGKPVPRDGQRCGLLAHVKTISQGAGAKDLRDQGEHAALLAVLTHYGD